MSPAKISKQQFANILLPFALDQVFTYSIPPDLNGKLTPGQRVIVQFGPRKSISGLIWEIHNEAPSYPVKAIQNLLDLDILITNKQKQLWEWMADYYLCSLGEIMKAALPAGLKLESHTRILPNPDFEAPEGLPEIEELAWLFLQKSPGTTIQDLAGILKRKNPLPIILSLQTRGAIVLEEKIKGGYKEKTTVILEIKSDLKNDEQIHSLLDQLAKAPKQLACLEAYLSVLSPQKWQVLQSTLQTIPGFSSSGLQGLVKKGILIKSNQPISRLFRQQKEIEPPKKLNEEQENCLSKLRQKDQRETVSLIHGITSSGKTEIYIHRIIDFLTDHKQVLYLLPEIALTEQIIERLRRVFGSQIGVYHSRYSDNERVEVYHQVKDPTSQIKIILGARSALFLPFINLGLVIVDEEHENSFKQYDPAPRYHARDAAIVLGRMHRAQVILGTATPALESYFNAQTGKYQLIELKQRYKSIPLPEIMLANLADGYRKKKMRGHFTPELLDAIDQALSNGEQVILFQNRRGFSIYLECDACGHVPKCRDCDVSLTLHKHRNRLVCHYCGFSIAVLSQCPSCDSTRLRTHGMGTEGLEDEISILFPNAKIARLDLDAARNRKAFSRILTDFDRGKTDILVGTQMISKGLDFKNVRVVGVVNADNLLHFPDFRSFERSFQLMTQVSGRAGRMDEQGLVIIQSFDPSHRILQQVLRNDFHAMYQTEMTERKAFAYPPFTRLISISLKHKDADLLARCAHHFAQALRKKWDYRILGPQAPAIQKIQKYHIRNILIKSGKGNEHKAIREDIRSIMVLFNQDKQFRQVIIQPNVDPF